MGDNERRPRSSTILGYLEDPLLRPGTRRGWRGDEFGDGVERNDSPKNHCGIRIGPVGYGQKEANLRRNGSGRISKISEDIQRRTIPSIPAKTTMGSRNRPTPRRIKHDRLQNLSYYAVGKGSVE